MRTIAISDIHGCFDEFNQLLNVLSYNPFEDRLFLLGDYVDRGLKSKETVQYVRQLSKHENTKVIGGNHDDMFLAWLDDRDYVLSPYTNERNGGMATILSFCPWFELGVNEEEVRAFIKDEYDLEVEFLRTLPHFIEDEKHIYVHAGIDPSLENWKETRLKDFRWIRNKFYDHPNRHGKTVVFGHTATAVIHKDPNNFHVWFGDGKIGIDGGTKFGGQLNALVIEGDLYKEYAVPVR